MYLWVMHMKCWSFSVCRLLKIGFWFDFFFFIILELDWLCHIGFAVIYFTIGLCIWKCWSFSVCRLLKIGFWFDFFFNNFGAWLVLLWFILQLGYAYEILELFCLQVIEDWFCIFYFFNLASWVMCRNFGPMWCCKYWTVAVIVAVIV